MTPPIQYNYVTVGTPLVEQLLLHVDRGESFILLGYQGCGKRHALAMLGRKLEQQQRPHLTVPFRDNNTVVTEVELLAALKDRLRGPLKDTFGSILTAANSLAEWFQILGELSNGRPIPCSFANLETLADALKENFLSFIRRAVEAKHIVVGLTGEGILARTLARDTSPFQCAHQFVVSGHDEETSRAFFLKRVEWCRLVFEDPEDKSWNAESAFAAFFAHTGGNLNLLRAILWCLSERRLRFDEDPKKHQRICRKALKKSFFSYTAIPLFGLRLFHTAKDMINMESEALDMVENMLDQIEARRSQGMSFEEAWSKATLPAFVQGPTVLELAGFLIRDAGRLVLKFPSHYVAEFAAKYFSWSCRGDFRAKHGEWDAAFERYEKVDSPEKKCRPLTQRDYQVLRQILNRLYREFLLCITADGGMDRMERRLSNAGLLLLGLKRACPLRVGDSGLWEEIRHRHEQPVAGLHQMIESILSFRAAKPARRNRPPDCPVHFDEHRRCVVVVSKPETIAPDPRHVVLFECADDGPVIEIESLRHRALETLGSIFLTCYNEARIWDCARGSRLRLGRMLEQLFSGATVRESVEALGEYLYTEFKASGVRLFLLDNHSGSLRSARSWGLRDPALRSSFDSGGLQIPRGKHPELWRAVDTRKLAVFRYTPPGVDLPAHTPNISSTPVRENAFSKAVERRPGDYWIDFPLHVKDQVYGKLTFAFAAHSAPTTAWIDDLEIISKILDQHLIRLRGDEVKMAEARAAQQRAISTTSHDLANRIATLPFFLAEYIDFARRLTGSALADFAKLNQRFEKRLSESMEVLLKAKKWLRAVHPELSEFDLCGVARESLMSIDPAIGGGSVCADTPDGCGPFLVVADQALLSSVLMELVNDSRTMFRPSGRLSVEISMIRELPEGRVRLNFRDNGPGIPDEYKNKVFDYFFSHRPGQSPGLGIGLGFIREVITAHGGTIRETGCHGQGVHFEILLPICQLPNAK